MGVQKADKTHNLWSFHYEHNYEQGAKQEALKGHFNLKFASKKMHTKYGALWATSMI